MKQSDLAQALSLSRAAVSRLVARGMPTSSAEAARAWRRDHVRVRMRPRTEGHPVSGAAARLLDRVTALAASAAEALSTGDGFKAIEPDLRAAIAALPDELRERVLIEWPTDSAEAIGTEPAPLTPAPCARVPLAVMDALTAEVRAVLSADQAIGQAEALPHGADELGAMGRFWLRVAAGEVRAAARCTA
jgi:hypothetical protein